MYIFSVHWNRRQVFVSQVAGRKMPIIPQKKLKRRKKKTTRKQKVKAPGVKRKWRPHAPPERVDLKKGTMASLTPLL